MDYFIFPTGDEDVDENILELLRDKIREMVAWRGSYRLSGENADREEGVSLDEIVCELMHNFDEEVIKNQVRWLVDKQELYTTIDREHYRM